MIEHEQIYLAMYIVYLCDVWFLRYDHVNIGPWQEHFTANGAVSILSPSFVCGCHTRTCALQILKGLIGTTYDTKTEWNLFINMSVMILPLTGLSSL